MDEYFSNILHLEVIILKKPEFLGNGQLGVLFLYFKAALSCSIFP